MIKLPSLDIRFEFSVPSRGNELLEPAGKNRQLVRCELRHLRLEFLHAHAATLLENDFLRKTKRQQVDYY